MGLCLCLCLLLSRASTLSLVACAYCVVSRGDLRELTARDGGCAVLYVLNSLFVRSSFRVAGVAAEGFSRGC
jgi:hypothetical protein